MSCNNCEERRCRRFDNCFAFGRLEREDDFCRDDRRGDCGCDRDCRCGGNDCGCRRRGCGVCRIFRCFFGCGCRRRRSWDDCGCGGDRGCW